MTYHQQQLKFETQFLYKDFTFPDTEVYDVQAINQAIENILQTRVGSLPGKPLFGSTLHKYLFSQIDHITISSLEREIIASLRIWEPRILVKNVHVKKLPEYNQLIVDLTFEYVDSGLVINAKTKIAFENI